MSRILRDILTETNKNGRTKYSQGRLYLFISFSVFFILNVILAFCAITDKPLEDKETLLVVSENLRWALGTFGLYVLGGKGIGAFNDRQTGISNDYQHEAQVPGYVGGYYPPGSYYTPPPGNPNMDKPSNNKAYHEDYDSGSGDNEFYSEGDEEVD